MAKFKFKKKYGQNFLQDERTIDEIANSIAPSREDLIIEIGPGAGALTKKLKSHGAQLVAFEIDEDTKKYLLPLEDERTKIVYSDFLEVDIADFLKNFTYERLFIIGNLPYYITTPIIEHIINSGIEHENLTIMVQREVADRFLATPGHKEYGYMTVLLNYHYKIDKIVEVDRSKFFPIPNVDSTVIKLAKEESPSLDYARFKSILKDSFQFKRKTIYNNLKKYDKILLEKILDKRGYNLTTRAEEIDLATYIDLANNLKPNIENRRKENDK